MARGKDKDDGGGPSKNQLRGLSYNHNLPAFLRNAQTALSGGSGQRQSDGRPPIPRRPGNNNDDDDDDNKLDERDLGDEAPLVVVLNESKDLTAEEAAQAQQDAPPVFDDGTSSTAKRGATLRFSNTNKSSNNNKRKIVGRSYEDDENDGQSESFNDLVKRAKVDPNNATTTKELPTSSVSKPVPNNKKDNPEEKKKEKKQLSKEEKAALKAKRKSAKKLLSFED